MLEGKAEGTCDQSNVSGGKKVTTKLLRMGDRLECEVFTGAGYGMRHSDENEDEDSLLMFMGSFAVCG